MRTTIIAFMSIVIPSATLLAAQFHVATNGNDDNRGAMRQRLLTIAPQWTWEQAARPLTEFVRMPRRTADPLLEQREARSFDGRQNPPPGSLKLLIPVSIRKHVLGRAKRAVLGRGSASALDS